MLSSAATTEARLSDVTDWRISIADPRRSVAFPAHKYVKDIGEAHESLATTLAQAIAAHPKHLLPSASFVMKVDEARYRVNHMGERRYALRVIPDRAPRLEKLGFLHDNVEFLASEKLRTRGGLILVLGTPGAGKTTTASGIVCSQLARHGGYALCVENPPEYRLEGFHGDVGGYCEQMDATDIGYSQALVDALRCFPTGRPGILMLGEIREKAEAYELMQIALDGHLVITTMHANDTIAGLTRLISMASSSFTSEDSVRGMLSASLRAVVHQRLSHGSAHMSLFDVNERASAILMNGQLHSLQDEMMLQRKNSSRLGQGHQGRLR